MAKKLTEHGSLAEGVGCAALQVLNERNNLGIAQAFDGHQDSMAFLANDRKQPARLLRQRSPFQFA